ncbi:hypothetical protein [Candidatus Hydrogenosomobacter endosymbioticus]|nr:hypothetical protein [Candidatus Hydrogenosomobacter endosymbioticus]
MNYVRAGKASKEWFDEEAKKTRAIMVQESKNIYPLSKVRADATKLQKREDAIRNIENIKWFLEKIEQARDLSNKRDIRNLFERNEEQYEERNEKLVNFFQNRNENREIEQRNPYDPQIARIMGFLSEVASGKIMGYSKDRLASELKNIKALMVKDARGYYSKKERDTTFSENLKFLTALRKIIEDVQKNPADIENLRDFAVAQIQSMHQQEQEFLPEDNQENQGSANQSRIGSEHQQEQEFLPEDNQENQRSANQSRIGSEHQQEQEFLPEDNQENQRSANQSRIGSEYGQPQQQLAEFVEEGAPQDLEQIPSGMQGHPNSKMLIQDQAEEPVGSALSLSSNQSIVPLKSKKQIKISPKDVILLGEDAKPLFDGRKPTEEELNLMEQKLQADASALLEKFRGMKGRSMSEVIEQGANFQNSIPLGMQLTYNMVKGHDNYSANSSKF